MERLREVETRISKLGITVSAKENGTIVVQQGQNIIEWGFGEGHTQMVLDGILTVSFSVEKDMFLSSRIEKNKEIQQQTGDK